MMQVDPARVGMLDASIPGDAIPIRVSPDGWRGTRRVLGEGEVFAPVLPDRPHRRIPAVVDHDRRPVHPPRCAKVIAAGIGGRDEGAHDPSSIRLLIQRADQIIEPVRRAREGAKADQVEIEAGARGIEHEGDATEASLEQGDEFSGGWCSHCFSSAGGLGGARRSPLFVPCGEQNSYFEVFLEKEASLCPCPWAKNSITSSRPAEALMILASTQSGRFVLVSIFSRRELA